MLVLTYAHDQLKSFVNHLPAILDIIRETTGQLFIPTSLNLSPIDRENDLMIILRSIERVDKLKLDSESILDHKRLAKQIVLKTISIVSKNLDEQRSILLKSLEQLYENEGLVLIGGIETESNQIQLMLYRQERRENTGERPPYELKIASYPLASFSDADFELSLNKAQIDSNSVMRSLIKLDGDMLVVYQENFAEDKLYMVKGYPQFIQGVSRAEFSEKMSIYLNIEEAKGGCIAVEAVTISNLKDSYLIYSQ
ncbi:hypothetical protein FGO68_gene3657 [Halteria grandinella]|uniref:Uncharacterized protein n=1 Tax=Halteria grandinella TaxID=5974 RepID=A0A8J8NJL4_HALGN|nr:hypothetical protein FGO68_gene3657 [Halteria grandinella]